MRIAQLVARTFVALVLVLAFTWGCGGPLPQARETGAVTFHIHWPSAAGVQAREMAPGTDLITIKVYQNGAELEDLARDVTPAPGGGQTTVTITSIPVGRTRFVAWAYDTSNPPPQPPLFNAWGTTEVTVRANTTVSATLTMSLVSPTPVPNSAPSAEIQATGTTGSNVVTFTCEGFDVDFNLDRLEIMYNWDGDPSSFSADATYDVSPDDVYGYWTPTYDYSGLGAGTYTAGLRAVDSDGLDGYASVQVTIPVP